MAAKTAATQAYDIEFKVDATEQELAVKLYRAADGIKPHEPHFARLARIVVRIAQRQMQKLREHRNAHEGDEEYEPPDAATEDSWQNDDAAMKEAFSRLAGELETLYAHKKMNAVTAAGNYTEAAKGQQKRLRLGVFEELNCILRNGLLAATRNITLLSHLANKNYVRTEIDNLDQITEGNSKRVVCLTATRLMIDIFNTMSKRGGANNQVLTTLFKPPNPLVDSFESMYADMDKSKTALLALEPEDAAGVLNVIMALQLKAYITAGATINDMPLEYQQAYRIVADEMESQSDDQAVPLDMEQMQYYGGKLRVALQSRNLQPVPTTSTAVAQAKAPKSDKAPKSSATDALEARLRKLEQAIPPKPPDKRRGGGRGRGAARGAARGARRGGSAPSADFECLCCGQTGCVPSTCPKGNKEAQRKLAERRAEREAANKEKAARRLRQGALNVSEDEASSEEETEEQCVASQSSSSPSPSQQLPHSSAPMLGTIYYETSTAASVQASTQASLPPTDKANPLPGTKRIARIMVAPILPQFLREGLATYQDTVVHLYQAQCRVQPSSDAADAAGQGAVVDTGAQRGAAKRKSEIVKYTGNTHKMVGALGKPVHMHGIIMGCETIDVTGRPLTLIVPDESVSDASLTDSLLPVGRLKEAGFDVRFRIPIEAELDGVNLAKYPKYGGYIVTPQPESRTIYMEYAEETWRLPLPIHNPTRINQPLSTINAFSALSDMSAPESAPPQNDSTHAERSEADQRRFELMCKRQQEAAILHDASGHRNPTSLVRDLKAAGIPVKHLQRYIHAHRCKYCEANLGRAGYQCQTAKQNGGGDLVISTIVDPLNPRTAITKTLADQHEVTSDPSPDTALRPFKTLLKGGPLHASLGKQLDEMQACVTDLNVQQQETPNCSPGGTDLRIDWADACSLGLNGERYFLLVVDKDTEYLANFNTKSRQNPVDLLRAYVNTTGKKPRYLRVDGAKEFASDEMVKYCVSENIILQTVVAYNHTMQARVEGAIGYVKQHSRVSMLAANVPTRFWPKATTDFIIKRNCLWYSEDESGQWSTPYQRMQPALASALTRKTVAIPFGSRVTSTIPREHSRVVNGSFGDRFVEGIYLHADEQTPTIRMYDIASRTELSVKDFKTYPEQFPFRDPTCLSRPTEAVRKELAAMHTEDDADDQLIAEELQMQVVTRAQKQAAERARDNAIIPDEEKSEKQSAPSKRQKPTKEKKVNSASMLISEMHELDLARDFVRYKYPVTLPKHYNPPDMPSPKGDMVVVGMKAQRETKDKAVVWVEFLSPPSHIGRQIQLYPRSLERKRGLAKGADFSLLTAIRTQHPSAKTWADLVVHVPSASSGTAAALAALAAYTGGTRFTADAQPASAAETSEQSPLSLHSLAEDEEDDPHAPPGYTRGMQDPKHRGHMLRSPMKAAWITAENSEMEGLARRKVWVRVHRSKLTAQDKVFSTRFHYKIKRKNGKFDKCKVRLVVQGQHMHRKDEHGVGDFEDAFSPVPHASGFRLILALATQHNMHCDHVDISQAFVQGDLLPGDGYQGKVYISPPPGFNEDPDYVYQLRRPLYGMPSAARAWHSTMSSFLKEQGCKTVGFERSMWTVVKNGHAILITAHIDDFILACADRNTLDEFRCSLLERFEGTYEGEIHSYLGCEIRRENDKTLLSQRHFAEDVLRTYDMWDCVPALTPMKPGMRLTKEQCNPKPDPAFHRRYRGIVGSLGYLVNMTRPDLAWSYSELSKYVQSPGKDHMDAANHVLRYLRGTFDQAIIYQRSHDMASVLWGWVDSDWAADLDSRRSHTGYVLMMTGGAVSWKSRRQDCVSLSTSEAEYVAASQCGQEVLYLREILRDFGYTQENPTNVYEDNLACVAMSENPVRRKFSRHIDIRYYFVRDLVAQKVIKLIPLRTHKMVADQLTKSLPAPAHAKHRDVMIGRAPFCARSLRSASDVRGG